MSKGQTAGMSQCHSANSEEGDLPRWTWWAWRPRDGDAQLEGREPDLSTQNVPRHMYVHVHTNTDETRVHVCTCIYLITQSHVQHVHTTQEHMPDLLETGSFLVGGKRCWLMNHWKPGQGEVG